MEDNCLLTNAFQAYGIILGKLNMIYHSDIYSTRNYRLGSDIKV